MDRLCSPASAAQSQYHALLQNRQQPDAPILFEQDVGSRACGLVYLLEVVGQVRSPIGLLVASAPEVVHDDAVAIPGGEEFDHAYADTNVDRGADMALGHRVVIVVGADVAVRPDLALDRRSEALGVERVDRARPARWPRAGLVGSRRMPWELRSVA